MQNLLLSLIGSLLSNVLANPINNPDFDCFGNLILQFKSFS